MKILITGASGLLGKSLIQTVSLDYKLWLTYHSNHARMLAPFNTSWHRLDIRNRKTVFELFDIVKPNLTIHCASVGSVDWTEDHYNEVRLVNVGGLGNVIDACNGYKSKLIYISSNAVYSGEYPPYSENSPQNPVNSYGVIKKDAEILVKEKANKWLIIRPFMLYGWPPAGARQNWASDIVNRLKSEDRKVIKLVNDTTWQPTYAPDCAQAIWELALQEIENTSFNVASPERATLYEFGLKVCDVFDLQSDWLRPVDSNFFINRVAKRPKDTSYDLGKLKSVGIVLSDIKTGLERMKGEMDV